MMVETAIAGKSAEFFWNVNRQGLEKKTKKAGSFLLSRDCSIIDVRELDFRVRNGNGYYLSTMATGILLPIFKGKDA